MVKNLLWNVTGPGARASTRPDSLKFRRPRPLSRCTCEISAGFLRSLKQPCGIAHAYRFCSFLVVFRTNVQAAPLTWARGTRLLRKSMDRREKVKHIGGLPSGKLSAPFSDLHAVAHDVISSAVSACKMQITSFSIQRVPFSFPAARPPRNGEEVTDFQRYSSINLGIRGTAWDTMKEAIYHDRALPLFNVPRVRR